MIAFRLCLSAAALGACLVLAAPTISGFAPAHADTTPVDISAAVALHDAARKGAGDPAAAVAALETLTAGDPANALAWAYLGSSYAISARDAGSVTDKIRFTNRGLRYLDQAVDMAPDDIVVRLIRANVLPNLPAMFGRSEMARDDMLMLDRAYSAAPDPALAAPMADIYDALAAGIAPEAGDWKAKADAARALAGGH